VGFKKFLSTELILAVVVHEQDIGIMKIARRGYGKSKNGTISTQGRTRVSTFGYYRMGEAGLSICSLAKAGETDLNSRSHKIFQDLAGSGGASGNLLSHLLPAQYWFI